MPTRGCPNSRSALRVIAFLLMVIMTIFTTPRRLGSRRIGLFANGFAPRNHPIRPQSSAEAARTRSSSRHFASSVTAETSDFGKNTNLENDRLFSEELNVLYDSKCNVCKLEMNWLVSRDIRLNGLDNRKLKLTDLESKYDETDPANGGIDYATGMAAIYAIEPDGTVHKGVPVFELAYDQVGLGWIWKINQIPSINRFLDWGYEIFARNRTSITRGVALEELLALHAAKQKELEDGECESCSNKYDNTDVSS